ncbi:MAG: cadherin domain-containing protein, partial [Desulfovibrionaceae bacterium]
MADQHLTTLQTPGDGKAVVVDVKADAELQALFDFSKTTAEQKGDDLVLTFENGGTIVLQHFVALAATGQAPQISLANGTVLAGDVLLMSLGIDQPNDGQQAFATSAGPGSDGGGGTYDDDLAGPTGGQAGGSDNGGFGDGGFGDGDAEMAGGVGGPDAPGQNGPGMGGFDTPGPRNRDTVTEVVDADGAANTVGENAAEGSRVGFTAYGSDTDARDRVTYSLQDDFHGAFTIDAATGVIRVANASLLDHETNPHPTVTVLATSTDGSSATLRVTIDVADGNDAPVIDLASVREFSNAVIPAVVADADASDPDAGAVVTYALLNGPVDDAGTSLFTVNAADGSIALTDAGRALITSGQAMNEAGGAMSFELTVRASDGTLTDQAVITVNVSDDLAPEVEGIASLVRIVTGDVREAVIEGTGEAGAAITVLYDGQELGTTEVADDGSWTLTVPYPSGSITVGNLAMLQVDKAGNERFTGGSGNGDLSLEGGEGVLDGGAGNDVLHFSVSGQWPAHDVDSPTGAGTSDSVDLEGVNRTGAVYIGGSGTDVLQGTDQADAIFLHDSSSTPGTDAPRLVGVEIIRAGGGDDVVDLSSSLLTYGNVTIQGDAGNDVIWSNQGADKLYGGTGDDQLSGGAGNDYLYGEAGNDTADGGEGTDRVYGGDGDDLVQGGAGTDYLYGGTGSDELQGGDGNDNLFFEAEDTDGDGNSISNDVFDGGEGTDYLHLTSGDDAISLTDESGNVRVSNIEYIKAYDGDDVVDMRGGDSIIVDAGTGDDKVTGGAGNDRIYGREGADVLDGGEGNNYLYGGADADDLSAGSGDDRLYGEDGDDVLDAGDGSNYLYGGTGNDKLSSGTGNDRLYGNDGDDELNAGDGNNYLYGGDGGDVLNAGDGNDYLSGDAGNDELNAGAGNDRLYGGDGDDVLNAGDGNDYLYAGTGTDALHGGDGNDNLYFTAEDVNADGTTYSNDLYDGGDGVDYLHMSEGNDVIDLDGSFSSAQVSGIENFKTYGGDDVVDLSGDGLPVVDAVVDAGTGDDKVTGGAGNDRIYGREGADVLDGGEGNNYLYGGAD